VNPYPEQFPRRAGETEAFGEIPQAKACYEEYDGIDLLKRGYLWDRNRLEKESSTTSMTCIMTRDRS
jgi:hypothetical protein